LLHGGSHRYHHSFRHFSQHSHPLCFREITPCRGLMPSQSPNSETKAFFRQWVQQTKRRQMTRGLQRAGSVDTQRGRDVREALEGITDSVDHARRNYSPSRPKIGSMVAQFRQLGQCQRILFPSKPHSPHRWVGLSCTSASAKSFKSWRY
jgi:hypothetical protein